MTNIIEREAELFSGICAAVQQSSYRETKRKAFRYSHHIIVDAPSLRKTKETQVSKHNI